MSNNLRILQNAETTLTCTIPSGFTANTFTLTVSALEFESSIIFSVSGSTNLGIVTFNVTAENNDLPERVYFYKISGGTSILADGSYSIENSPDIAPSPIIDGQVTVITSTDFYDKPAINAYSASTLININSKLPIVTFAAYTGATTLNNYYNKTQINLYSGATDTKINTKLTTSNFNSYSGNTLTTINNKLNKSDFNTFTGTTLSNFNTFTGTTLCANYYNKTQINSYTGATDTKINNRLLASAFSTYTGATLTNINTRLLSSAISAWALAGTKPAYTASEVNAVSTTNFNTYSGNTNTAINNKLSTSIYSTYTGNTQTAIGLKLTTSAFNTYSGNTATAIGLKLNKTDFNTLTGTTLNNYAQKANAVTGATNLGTGTAIYTSVASNKIQLKSLKVLGGISITNDSTSITLSGGSTGGGTACWGGITGTLSAQTDLQAALNSKSGTGHTHTQYELKTDFNTYTGATATAIGNKLATSVYSTYTGATATAIGLKLNTSAISAWALAGTKPAYTASEVNAVSTTNFNTFSGTTLPANYYNKTQINAYTGATNTLIGNRLLTSTYSTYTGATATAIGLKLATSTYSTYTGATLTAINGKLATAGCAADSAKLNNVLPAGYLLSGGTAKNSLCLGGNLANTYLSTTACAADSAKLNNVAASGYLTTTGCAADSAKLNNKLYSWFLPSTGTSSNSLGLCGCVPTCFATAAQGTLATNALPSASYTASDILTKISTVDGAASGLDADLLDGVQGSCYQQKAAIVTYTGTTAPAAFQSKSSITTYTGTTAPAAFASKTNAVTGATNLGTGQAIYTSVASNKVQLKGLKVLGSLAISNDSTSITLSGASVSVTGATSDVFSTVTDGQLMFRCGTAICGKSTATFLASGGTAICATNSACLGGVLPAGYVTSAQLTGTQLLLGAAGTSNGNGIRHSASRVTVANKPTAPVVGLNAACSLSVTQVFEAGIIGYSASAARNLTLPTSCGASGLVQALPCAQVGDVFQMTVYNTCTFAVTILGGTNTTIVNTNTVTCTNSPRLLNFRVTGIGANAETISVY